MERIYYNRALKSKAQELRRDATPQENRLWYDYLKRYPIQFRRQKQFARYIVDFYCSQAKLIVELDGSQHYTEEGLIHDRSRTVYLESLGMHVLRFTNNEVMEQFESVCDQIDYYVKKRIK